MYGSLDSMGDPSKSIAQLILDAGEPGVEQGGVEYHLVKQCCSQLIEPSFYGLHVLAEVLDHLE